MPEFDKRVIRREVTLDPFKDASKFFRILTICDFFIKISERYSYVQNFTCDQKVDWLSHICCQSEVKYVVILTVVKLSFDCISEQHNQENLIFSGYIQFVLSSSTFSISSKIQKSNSRIHFRCVNAHN